MRFSVNFLTFPPLMNNTFSYKINSPCVFSVWPIWTFINSTKHRNLEFLLLIPMEKNDFRPSSCISRHSNDVMCKQPIPILLCAEFTGISCNSAFPYKAPPAVRECIYRDLYLHSACMQFLSVQKRIKFACPALLWPVDEKQAYVDSTHLNNSEKWSWIIYGTDKIHKIIY